MLSYNARLRGDHMPFYRPLRLLPATLALGLFTREPAFAQQLQFNQQIELALLNPSLVQKFLDFIVPHLTVGNILALIGAIAGLVAIGRVVMAMTTMNFAAPPAISPRTLAAVVVAVLAIVVSGWGHVSDTKVFDASAGLAPPQAICKRDAGVTAIVLIHGWNGSADVTWAELPKLLCEDKDWSDADIYVVNYPTYMARRQLQVDQLARWLRQSFFSDTLRNYEDIHLIVHSMGGPIARSIYVRDLLQGDSKIRSIVSIASPFLGANIASLASALGVSRDLTSDMKAGSSFLNSLANDWTDARTRPATYCFTSPDDSIVASNSAKSQCECTHDYPQWGHVEMVKPATAADERYRMPIRALKNIVAASKLKGGQRPACFSLAQKEDVRSFAVAH